MAVKCSTAGSGLTANAAAIAAASGGTLVTADVQALGQLLTFMSTNSVLTQQVLQNAGSAGVQQLLPG